jgi:dephospho-CoA kinase
MLLIGLTGGMGSGKSSVSARLAALGAVVVDADAITRSLQQPGQAVFDAMVERFGPEIVASDGSLNRQAVADVVFDDPRALADLNAIVHPAVGAEIAQRLETAAASDDVVILDVPLLVESGRSDMAALVVVDVDPEVAVERLVKFRGIREPDARSRMARQATRSQRLSLADFVVDNSGTEQDLDREVERLWNWITGSGKSATIAWTIEQVQRPTLVLAPNKTLAAQLANEFREFFPNNAVEYFVSYYDYYQPEAYMAADRHLHREGLVDQRRGRAAAALGHLGAAHPARRHRRGLGVVHLRPRHPAGVRDRMVPAQVGEEIDRDGCCEARRHAVHPQRHEPSPAAPSGCAATPSRSSRPTRSTAVRIEFFGDEIERSHDPAPADRRDRPRGARRSYVFPATHYVAGPERMARGHRRHRAGARGAAGRVRAAGQAARGPAAADAHPVRPRDDAEVGFCNGHRELLGAHRRPRARASRPTACSTTSPRTSCWSSTSPTSDRAADPRQYEGDRSRKRTLIEHGFRLPSAADNRPLRFEEFLERIGQTIFLSATPAPTSWRSQATWSSRSSAPPA